MNDMLDTNKRSTEEQSPEQAAEKSAEAPGTAESTVELVEEPGQLSETISAAAEPAATAAETKTIDINAASLEEIDELPGIGVAMATRIIEARPYASVEDLTRVQGINKNVLEKLREHISVTRPPAEEAPEATLVEEQPETVVALAETAEEEVVTEPEIEQVPLGEAPSQEAEVESAAEAEKSSPVPSAVVTPPPAAAPVAPERGGYPLSTMLWISMGSSLLTLLLAIILSLGILAAINGGIQFVRPAELVNINRQVAGLSSQADILRNDLNGLRGRLDNLEGLSGRVGALERSATEMASGLEEAQADLAAVGEQVQALDAQLDGLQTSIDALQEDANRFNGFLAGLAELLAGLATPDLGGK